MSVKVHMKSYRTQVVGKINQGAMKGVQDSTLDLLGRSVRLAPVDTGDLRGSASASVNGTETGRGTREGNVRQTAGAKPPMSPDRIEGVVSFNTPYALRQHEMLEANHPKGGQAKYLEQPALENQDRYMEHIRAAIRDSVDE